MDTFEDCTCPLCGSPAMFRYVNDARWKNFVCEKCSLFQISVRAEHRLSSSPDAWRAQLSKTSQECGEDHALVITLGNQENPLVAESRLRTTLPRE
jgi:hypothetical protein